MNVMKQRDKSTMVVSLYFDQQRLLLLLLLLSGGKAGDSANTDVEDGEEENADNTTHEDSYERMSAQDSIR
jgi:hypothetical protein